MIKTYLKSFTVAITMALLTKSAAEDKFPIFAETNITITVPAKVIGVQKDAAHLRGSNYVYGLRGQIFSKSSEGHIQSMAEGFSGTSDKGTPWKTVTELLAVYQNGAPETRLRSLYTASSGAFLDKLYTNHQAIPALLRYGTSITNMQALAGYDFKDGFVVFVRTAFKSGQRSVMPFYLISSGNQYRLSEINIGATNLSIPNVGAFLNSTFVTNVIN